MKYNAFVFFYFMKILVCFSMLSFKLIPGFSIQVEVNFCDKNLPNDPGFNLQLSQRINYDQVLFS